MKIRDVPHSTVVRLKKTNEVVFYEGSDGGIAKCFRGGLCVNVLDVAEVDIVDGREYWNSPDVSDCFIRDLRG